jgi:phosphopantothenoylcysteine decarboxylase/phosphopantothenate--cysteine ligase
MRKDVFEADRSDLPYAHMQGYAAVVFPPATSLLLRSWTASASFSSSAAGIAAFRALDLIRRLRERGATVTPVLTRAAEEFVTPLSVSALAASKVYRDLFDLTDEAQMGHIELSRAADRLVVCPATANLMARMAGGLADDLATTLLMATDKPVSIVPAMNVRMWEHPAMRRNLATLRADGVDVIGPVEGPMACGEHGPGRMADIPDIVSAIEDRFAPGPLAGRHALVTSGPTYEPIDPVRYLANRSSGAQGTAIAAALRDLGARVTFVTGPAAVPAPAGVRVIAVETAREMRDAILAALPADMAVMAAAVADWRVENASDAKIKKGPDGAPALSLAENPDILAEISRRHDRPRLVVGFAAETEDVTARAVAKRARKGCDWIVANDVSPGTGIMGGTENAVTLVTADGVEDWPRMSKTDTARRLARRITEAL